MYDSHSSLNVQRVLYFIRSLLWLQEKCLSPIVIKGGQSTSLAFLSQLSKEFLLKHTNIGLHVRTIVFSQDMET